MRRYSQANAECLSGICVAIVKPMLNVWRNMRRYSQANVECLGGICVAIVKPMLNVWAEYASL